MANIKDKYRLGKMKHVLPDEQFIPDGYDKIKPKGSNIKIDYKHIANVPDTPVLIKDNNEYLEHVTVNTTLQGDGKATNPLGIPQFYFAINTGILLVSNWVSLKQSITVSGLTFSSDVIVSPNVPYANILLYAKSQIAAIGTDIDIITFECTTLPTSNIEVIILILKY